MAMNASQLPMPASYFMLVLREWGVAPELRQQLLAGFADGDVRTVEVGRQVQQLRVLNSRLPEGWGLKLGSLFDATTHGPVGTAVLSAPTLASALDVIVRFGHVRTPFMRFALERGQGRVRLRFIDSEVLTETDARPLHDATLVGVQSLLKHFLAGDFQGMTIEVDHPEPRYSDEYRVHLKGDIEFGRSETSIVFQSGLLERRSPFDDFDQFQASIRQLQSLAYALDAEEPLLWKVRRIFSADGKPPTLSEAARRLRLSDRTLIRRLADLGTSYRALADTHRRAQAEMLLCDESVPISEVSHRLGYSDLANFGRSCRRWFGVSPGQYRRAERAPKDLPSGR